MTTLTDEQIEAIRKRDQHVRKKCEAWASINTDWKPLLEDMPVSIGDVNDALGDRAALLADRDHWKKRAEKAEARLQWRDISTAPKDGTPIIIGWIGENGWTERRAWWADGFECVGYSGSRKPKWRGAWTDNSVSSFVMEEVHEYKPTRWMPLPPEPKS